MVAFIDNNKVDTAQSAEPIDQGLRHRDLNERVRGLAPSAGNDAECDAYGLQGLTGLLNEFCPMHHDDDPLVLLGDFPDGMAEQNRLP